MTASGWLRATTSLVFIITPIAICVKHDKLRELTDIGGSNMNMTLWNTLSELKSEKYKWVDLTPS